MLGCRYQHYILIVLAQLWLRNKFSLSFMGFTFTLFWVFTQSAANLCAIASTRRWMSSASHPAPAEAAAFGSILSMSGSVFSCYLWTDVNHPRQSFFFQIPGPEKVCHAAGTRGNYVFDSSSAVMFRQHFIFLSSTPSGRCPFPGC